MRSQIGISAHVAFKSLKYENVQFVYDPPSQSNMQKTLQTNSQSDKHEDRHTGRKQTDMCVWRTMQ